MMGREKMSALGQKMTERRAARAAAKTPTTRQTASWNRAGIPSSALQPAARPAMAKGGAVKKGKK